jgi:hypothetical protein
MGRMVMAHAVADVAIVKCRANGLGSLISGVDDAGDICHFNQATSMPILKGKILYVYMTSTFRGHFFVDDVQNSLVIFM